MTAFFIPGLADQARTTEREYMELRRQVEVRMGRAPRTRRILELWSRRGRQDCVTRVGAPDPICGEIVVAIFDMGPNQPFVIWRQSENGIPADTCEVLACNAYSVSEFERP